MAEISKQALLVANNTDFPNNNAGAITPAILRSYNTDMIDSTVNQTQYNTNSGSWNISIGALNAFTASQQPSFNALNAFTASQLTINTGYNAATQSLSASIAPLQPQINSLNSWTSSVNQIADNGIVQGTSTRLHFYGLVSASIVPNVNGAIASINIEQDGTKVDTGSFNALTQSVNGILDYTSSLKTAITVNGTSASIAGNLDVVGTITARQINTLIESSSIIFSSGSNILGDADNDTQTLNGKVTVSNGLTVTGNLTASALINGVDLYPFYTNTNSTTQSLNNSVTLLNSVSGSSNAYTASNNTKWSTLGLLTGSYAVTGSNTFRGKQTITGSIVLGNTSFLELTPSSSAGGNSAIRIYTKPSGSSPDYWFNIQPVPFAGNSVAFANFSNGGDTHFVLYDLDNNRTNMETPLSIYNTSPGITMASNYQNSGSAYNVTFGYVDNTTDPANVFSAIALIDDKSALGIGLSYNSYTPYYATSTPMIYANQTYSGSDAAIAFPADRIDVWKPSSFKVPVQVTGSVTGNIVPLTITSNTASMNLAAGNFFSLTLVSGSTTRLTATNIKPGQTINLLLTQPASTGSLTFSPSFKFSGGVPVSASQAANAKDIITFVTFDTSSVYTAIIKNLS